MFIHEKNDIKMTVDFEKGYINSLVHKSRELLSESKAPLFIINMMDDAGNTVKFDTFDAKNVITNNNSATYKSFPEDISVTVSLNTKDEYFACWNISIKNNSDKLIEWVEFMDLPLCGKLTKNGGDGKFLYPFCEGVIVDDIKLTENHFFEQKYPCDGSSSMFPHMVFTQFLSYMFGDYGLYIGAHDTKRGVKWIAFPEEENSITTKIRMYPGLNYGEDFNPDFPYVFDFFEGDWHDGAEIYRKWLYNNLPYGLDFLKNQNNIPDWYKNMPLVVIYPVRGGTDTDDMEPNSLYPYENALPVLREISEKTNSQVMALLMHWEGTAPWAPPYVWPPFGGEEIFNKFADELHKDGNLLGVYCSGIGWTSQSKLLKSYNMDEVFEKNNYWEAMCLAPDGTLPYGRICVPQRTGYDLCPASDVANKILDDAYIPLLKSKVDYAQLLDQNNGGNSYFCYSKNHGHPPAPGTWQIETMNSLMDKWNDIGKGKLIGCETGAAEPFLNNLKFSDNRFEFTFGFGQIVPLYAYLFHEFLHNFMGNQCSCPLKDESLSYRLAHSFTAGDCLSLVLTADQKISKYWGSGPDDGFEDKEKILTLIHNLSVFTKEKGLKWLYDGKMIKPLEYTSSETVYFCKNYSPTRNRSHYYSGKDVLSSAWENSDGEKIQIFVNHTTTDKEITFKDGNKLLIPAQSAKLIEI